MKILRIIYDFPPPWTGLAPFPYELTKTEAQNGNEITVICGLWPKALPSLPQLNKNIKLIRIFHEILRHTMFFTTAPIASIAILFEVFMGRYEVVVGHGQLPLYYHLFRLCTFGFLQPKYIFCLHITAAGRRIKAQQMGDKIGFLEKIEWFLHEISDQVGVKVARHVLVTGENIKTEAIDFYHVPDGKITVIENGVDIKTFNPQGNSVRKDLGYLATDKILLFVGVHNSRKGIYELIEALAKLPTEYKLLTVGGGENDYLSKLRELTEKLGLTERVKMVGVKPYPIPEYFRAADLFVIPSSFEGFPKVVLESLACGTPVLASGFEVTDCPKGLKIIPKLKSSNLDLEIKTYLESKPTVDLETVEKRYSWEAVAAKFAESYKL